MATFIDEFSLDGESRSEQLARELAESDINLIYSLRKMREERGLSQADLGQILGVTQATVSAFESGESEPKLSTVRRYAHALDVMIVHSVRPCDGSAPEGFVWEAFQTPVPARRPSADLSSYRAANSKRTDFALAG